MTAMRLPAIRAAMLNATRAAKWRRAMHAVIPVTARRGALVVIRMQLHNRTDRLVDVLWNIGSARTVRHRALAAEDRAGLARPRRGAIER